MATIGMQMPWFDWPGSPDNTADVLREAAQAAEASGFTSLWVMDHFFQLPGIGEATMQMLEGYTTLAYLAAVTEHATLGTLVTGVTYRYPALLVKEVTTLDVLSKGRAWLGIGAAWFEREHEGLGVPFPPVSERFERLEETLRIAEQMWSDDDGPFEGTHYTLAETICSPQPLSRPRPRIMVGGGGERKTLRLVAKYADACNIMVSDPAEAERKFAILQRHCDEIGRDYSSIERTVMMIALPGTDPKDVVAQARPVVDAGAQHVIFTALPTDKPDEIRRFGETVAPTLA